LIKSIYLDFTVVFVKKGKVDFLILAKNEHSLYLMFVKLEELKKQDFLLKDVYCLNFNLVFKYLWIFSKNFLNKE